MFLRSGAAGREALRRVWDVTRAAITAAAEPYGVPCGWGRVFWLHVPHEAGGLLVSDAGASLLSTEEIACSAGLQRWNILHVANVATAFVVGLRGASHGPLNVGSGAALAVRDVLETVGELTGRPELIRFDARRVAPDAPPKFAANAALLSDQLGILSRHGLRDGLVDAVAWWRTQQARTRWRPPFPGRRHGILDAHRAEPTSSPPQSCQHDMQLTLDRFAKKQVRSISVGSLDPC